MGFEHGARRVRSVVPLRALAYASRSVSHERNDMSGFSAESVYEKMKGDRFATDTVGVELIELAPNRAKTMLRIEEKHLNAVGIVQGGALFTLADFTFALASNTGEAEIVGIESNISYIKPARLGDIIYAEAREIHRSKSLSSFDVMITDEQDQPIARFYARGFVRTKRT